MAQKDNILQELKELQSLLANVTIQNIYRVPSGYFEGLTNEVMRRIKALEALNAAEELGHLTSLFNNAKGSVYTIPAGYFEELTGQVLCRLKALEAKDAIEELNHLSPLLGNISKAMPNTVPTGYFQDLESTAGSLKVDDEKVAEELETLSPLLSGLKKEMPYSVPKGYFENIGKAINAETVKREGKVVSISITKQKWFRYAAAAVVVSFVVLAGLLIFNKPGKIDPNAQSFAWVEKSLKKVSADDIDKFAELADDGTLAVADKKNNTKEVNEIRELIKDIPDEELQQFLDEAETSVVDEANEDDIFMN